MQLLSMSSTHYMAQLLRVLSSQFSSSSTRQRYRTIAVLLTLSHLICHIACVPPSSGTDHNSVGHEHRLEASTSSMSPHLKTTTGGTRENDGQEWNQSTLIIINDEEDDNVGDIERSFLEFLTMFNITFNRDVNFIRGEGLNTLLWQAENSNYATVLYVLSSRDSSHAGYCDLTESMTKTFNKTIIIWPCPNMKSTEPKPKQPALPSYETVSFAVKSISQEFNWTEAVIFVAGTNWGLPLAIAANLHVPYRIEMNFTNAGQIEDKLGAAVILTSSVNSIASNRLLYEFRSFLYTKVLVIDITGAIFSHRNYFSGYLTTKEEMDYIFENWSERNYRPEDEIKLHRAERSSDDVMVDQDRFIIPSGLRDEEAVAVMDDQGDINSPSTGQYDGRRSGETNSKKVDQKFVGDLKPQNFLILTVLTEKLKTLHDTALHVEFEQYYKLSRSGIVDPFGRSIDGYRESVEAKNGGGLAVDNDDGDEMSRERHNENTARFQLWRQIKRSEEIIVTGNGTSNCNTGAGASVTNNGVGVDEEKQAISAVAASVSKTNVKDSPKSGGDKGDCATPNKRRQGSDKATESPQYLISKLPIFTSLTTSINESIQLLFTYVEKKNCTPSMEGNGNRGNMSLLIQECASALNCSVIRDVNEQLFCNYLCQVVVMVVNNSVTDNAVDSESVNVDSFNASSIVDNLITRRFDSRSEVAATIEHMCRHLSELSSSTEWTEGLIQMQLSKNLLYFYNENVVSKHNDFLRRHKSKGGRYQKRTDSSLLMLQNRGERLPRPSGYTDDIFLNGMQSASRDFVLDKRDASDDPDLQVTGDGGGSVFSGKDYNADSHQRSELAAAAALHYAKYNEYFSLFDYIVAATAAEDRVDATDDRIDFIILDFQNVITPDNYTTGVGWRPLLIVQQNLLNKQAFTTYSILPGYNDWTLVPTQNFMDCGLLCIGVIVVAVFILCTIIVGGVASAITIRNYLLKKRLSKGPNKVVLSPSDFVFPVDSRRVDEGIEAMLCCFLQQLQEFGGPEVEKPDVVKGSISSLKTAGLPAVQNKTNTSGSGSLARHNTVLDMRARYNGDLVQLKEIAMLIGTELKTKAMDHLVMTHGLRHENINPFIGWLSDSNRTAMVFEYCSRGSLQDVLIMDEIKLDWSFRLSLLTDLVRGMRYLHSSPLRVHGGLTSRNCVVDARWVLKITDYGMPSFYDTIGVPPPTKSAKELLWTAPEALRTTKGFPKCGTQMGDVYSFAIIMQEVVVRGEPYCMLSLSPEEIIVKIKKPPPLIRPSVSKGAAPPEAINIMRQCWAEMPDMRPDFNTVYERFKQLNHGRKVNFVDTMFQMLEKYSNNLEELIRERTDQLDMERKKTEQLLNRMLPNTVAEKLKVGLGVEPEEFSEVTIYFSDIVGFTTIAAHCSPVQVVDLLNDLYTCFDATINAYNVYKVETIGDAYMVVSGLPSRIPDHAEQIATMALDLLHESGRFGIKHLPGVPLQLRIGLHSGPCCAGVVGLTMPRYCLFGDTVNTASRMESTGSSWRIHLSESTRDRLVLAGGYHIESRGLIDIKGKGMMNTYWLLGKKGFDKPLPDPPPIGESHGLDESLIRNSIRASQQLDQDNWIPEGDISSAAMPTLTHNKSDAMVEVKVEITPPALSSAELQHLPPQSMLAETTCCPQTIATSQSLDSSPSQGALSISQQDFPPRASVSLASPQQRKMSEFSQDSLLNPTTFTRMTPSPGANSSRLFKKIEEMMDLSSPYNHYRCLSSESSLAQCGNSMMGMGSALQNLATLGGNLSVPSPFMMNCITPNLMVPVPVSEQTVADGGKLSVTRNAVGGDAEQGGVDCSSRPGSGRLLRRQFSLDKDDVNNHSATSATLSNNLGNSACFQAGAGGGGCAAVGKSYLERVTVTAAAPVGDAYQKHSSLPSIISGQTVIGKVQQQANNRAALFKHNSSSISQDLEKIEEIPSSSPTASSSFSENSHHQQLKQQQQQSHRLNHAPYSQTSLTNSIPYIDGSCSSSVSTLHSSGPLTNVQQTMTTGSRMTMVREGTGNGGTGSTGGDTKLNIDV